MFRLGGETRLVFATFFLAFGLQPSVLRAEETLRQVIDTSVRKGWQTEKLAPAGLADDATFLRRVYLDLVGTIPTADEARQFLKDADPQKRTKLIDRLLADPRFATNQANVWDQVLFGRKPGNPDATRNRDGFKTWLADKFAKNVPYDQWVGSLLSAEEEGSELYYVQYRNQPEETAVAVSRIFLGMQLQCARCHNHPFDNWTQRDFYGLAGFFVRLVVLEGGTTAQKRYRIGEKSTGEVLFTGAVKDQKPGQKGEPVKPKFLAGAELTEPVIPKDFKEPEAKGLDMPKPGFSRKAKLTDWLVAADNPYLARAVANRVWAQFMGRGIVHPVDDLGDRNKASLPDLLDALTAQLQAHKFDLKWFIREIVSSEAYQQSATGPSTDALPSYYERARVRPLSAEEIIAAMRVATSYDADAKAAAVKLTNNGDEYFMRHFGEPTNGMGDFQGSMAEHLFLNNSPNVRQLIQRKKGNLADQVLTSKDPWEQRVEHLFLAILSRPPKPEEQKRFVAYLTADPKADPLVEDAIWVLLNTAEFRFNH